MAVIDITRYVKRSGKSGNAKANNKEAGKIHLIQVFRIEKQVGDAEVFAKAAHNHGVEYYPA